MSSNERPGFSNLTRQHSRSSSQLATLGSLSLPIPTAPPSPTKRSGAQSPRYSIDGLRGYESPSRYSSRGGSPNRSGDERRRGSASGPSRDSLEEQSESSPEFERGAFINEHGLSLGPPSHSLSCESLPITSRSNSAFTSSSGPSLATLIQEKRRQASAPYLASARSSSLFSPGAGFGISSISNQDGSEVNNGTGTWAGGWGANGNFGGADEEERRARSRKSSRGGTVSGLSLKPLTSFSTGGEIERDGLGMVMTPTTEEWRQLGGRLSELADIRARDEARLSNTQSFPLDSIRPRPKSIGTGPSTVSSSSSSSSMNVDSIGTTGSNGTRGLNGFEFPSRVIISPATLSPLSLPVLLPPSIALEAASPVLARPEKFSIPSSFSFQTSRTGFTSHSHSTSLSYDPESPQPSSPGPTSPHHTDPLPSIATFVPTHNRVQLSESSLLPAHLRPSLTRGSLSSTTGKPGSPSSSSSLIHHPFNRDISSTSSFDSPLPSPPAIDIPLIPIELDSTNSKRDATHSPVDPRRYSAYNGLRTIESFVVDGEAGKGAYGTVQRAREKGLDGLPTGPFLIIKYIIKQRILADCWKKHKILGPIPVEVHVLDHLRRVLYTPRISSTNRSSIVKPVNEVEKVEITGHPNICGMLDFFEDGEFYYLVMPRAGESADSATGQDLFDFVDLHPNGLLLPSILKIFSQVADAIYFLHEHGIVHRDIKDENIVLDRDGNVQLIDFGSAAYVKEGKKFDTFSGTLDFAAPEVLRGERYGGKETDIWALGVLGYVIICGECPFWSPEEAIRGLYQDSRAELALRAKSSASPTSSSSSNESPLPSIGMSEMVDIVIRCLEVDPQNRPTADQVLDHSFISGSAGWRGYRGWE